MSVQEICVTGTGEPRDAHAKWTPTARHEECATSIREIKLRTNRYLRRQRLNFESFKKEGDRFGELNPSARADWEGLQETPEDLAAWLPSMVSEKLLAHADIRASLAIRFRLANEEAAAKCARNMRHAIQAAGGWEEYRYVPWETRDVVRLLDSPRWIPEWPDFRLALHAARQIFDGLEAGGRTEFTPNVDSIKTRITEIVRSARAMTRRGVDQRRQIEKAAFKHIARFRPVSGVMLGELFSEISAREPATDDAAFQSALQELVDEGLLSLEERSIPNPLKHGTAVGLCACEVSTGNSLLARLVHVVKSLIDEIRIGVGLPDPIESQIDCFLHEKREAVVEAMLRAVGRPGQWQMCGAQPGAFHQIKSQMSKKIPGSCERFTSTKAADGCRILYSRPSRVITNTASDDLQKY